MPINKAWHAAHPLPPRATFEQRAAWHLEHAEVCGCRPIPARLAEALRASGRLSGASEHRDG